MSRTLSPLPARKAGRSIDRIASAKADEVVLHPDGRVSLSGTPRSFELASRLIEGHPDDVDAMAVALQDPRVRVALLIDIDGDAIGNPDATEMEEDVLGPRAIKIVSALYSAQPTDFDGFLILSMSPLSDHVRIFRQAVSAHARMEIHSRDPDLRAILERDWRQPFHGHDHQPGLLTRLARALRRQS